MSIWKRILIIAICLLTILSSGYAVIAGIAQKNVLSGNTTVAKVGRDKIKYAEYYELLDYYMQSWYSVGAEYLDSYFGAEYGNSVRESVIQELIDKKIALQHKDEYGLKKLTPEMEAEIQAYIDSYYAELDESITASVTADYTDEDGNFLLTDEEFKNEVEKEKKSFLEESGYSDEYLHEYYVDYFLINQMYAAVTAEAMADEDDFREKYDALVAEQKATAEEDLETAFMYYDNGYNDVNVYIPGEVKYVKQILIQLSEEQMEELAGIEDEAEHDAKYREMMNGIKPRAEEVLARLNNGEDFDEVMLVCSDDEYKDKEPYGTEGYDVHKNSGYVESFEKTALSLKNIGDISGLVESEYGYHILKLVSIKEAGEIPFEDVRADIEELVTTDMQYTAWEEKLEEWKASTKIKKYESRYLSDESAEADAEDYLTEAE